MLVGFDSVVVLKLPGLLRTNPDGASVIVDVAVWYPVALTVTVTVPVLSRAWMKMAGLPEEPAPTSSGSWPAPGAVPARANGSFAAPPLVRVTATPPAGAGAPRLTWVGTCRSLPMVWGENVIAGGWVTLEVTGGEVPTD